MEEKGLPFVVQDGSDGLQMKPRIFLMWTGLLESSDWAEIPQEGGSPRAADPRPGPRAVTAG